MKIISEANAFVLQILENFKSTNGTRLLHYVVEEQTEEGVLLHNMLTKEMLLLSPQEYENLYSLDYLKNNWFLVPEETKEKELVDFVRYVLSARQKRSDAITGYTIFTTTDCNARCFYCYELGRSRIPMTEETAHKVAKYIHAHCGGKKVRLQWYGGEPLYNPGVIDIICSDLQKMGVEYRSTAISNGYLFDEDTVRKAVSLWKLERVQIPMDGTEKVYNKIKAYIYKGTNPYRVILENMERLLAAGVTVTVRMNMDLRNAEDLLALVDDLAEHFADKSKIHLYADHIFETGRPMAESYSQEEWVARDKALHRLMERVAKNGFLKSSGIKKNVRVHYCMADSGHDVTVTPDGHIGLCDHFSESEFIGHIDSEQIDGETVKSWKQVEPAIPECAQCFYYPQCIRLKKCAYRRVCFEQLRNDYLLSTKLGMRHEYQSWQESLPAEEAEEVFC